MKILVPHRDQILARIPLFCRINPLRRPRANYFHRGSVRTDLSNQKELFNALKNFHDLKIAQPIFLDIFINFTRVASDPKRNPPRHPVKTRQGDIDNLSKAVNDGLVKAQIIVDDIWIVGQHVTKAYGTEEKACVVIWSAHLETVEINPWATAWQMVGDSTLDHTNDKQLMLPFET